MRSDGERQSYNELFPSADWRYLLPDPAPTSVVMADLTADLVVDLVTDLTVDLTEAPLEAADLGVADRADADTIARLDQLVRPGGAIYLEVQWPRSRRAVTLAHRLTTAGFDDPVLYSLSPSDDRWSASWWMPVGHPEALRFVAAIGEQGRRANRSIVDRFRAGVVRAITVGPALARHHPWLLWPTRRQVVCAVAVKPGASGEEKLSARPGLLSTATPSASGRRRAVMRVGGSSTDQAMLFGFGDSAQPDLVIKAPTRPEELAATGHEAEVLALLTDRPDPMPGVPRPVPLDAPPGVAAWGQTFLPGSALATIVDRVNLYRHGAAMTDWLIELAARTGAAGGGGGMAATAVEELGPLWRLLPDGATLRGDVEGRLRGFDGSTTVCQHRDLGPWNTLVDGDTLGVIDWADAEPSGAVLCDLHHFLAHLVLCANDAYGPDRRHEVIARLVDRGSPEGGLVDRCLERYAVALGLSAPEVEALRLLTWLLDLLRRPPSEQLDSIYLDLLRAELR